MISCAYLHSKKRCSNVSVFSLHSVHFHFLLSSMFLIAYLTRLIYSITYIGKKATTIGFKNKVAEMKSCEFYNAKRNSKCHKYYQKWYNVKNIDQTQYEDSQTTDEIKEYILNCKLDDK